MTPKTAAIWIIGFAILCLIVDLTVGSIRRDRGLAELHDLEDRLDATSGNGPGAPSVEPALVETAASLDELTARIAEFNRERQLENREAGEPAEMLEEDPPPRRDPIARLQRMGSSNAPALPNMLPLARAASRMVNRQVEEMSESLGLSKEQEIQIREAMTGYHESFQEVILRVRRGEIDQTNRNQVLEDLRKERLNSIREVLDEDQYQVYRERFLARTGMEDLDDD